MAKGDIHNFTLYTNSNPHTSYSAISNSTNAVFPPADGKKYIIRGWALKDDSRTAHSEIRLATSQSAVETIFSTSGTSNTEQVFVGGLEGLMLTRSTSNRGRWLVAYGGSGTSSNNRYILYGTAVEL